MQNKGDMMSSVGFLYNYIAFFAFPPGRRDDPFYMDVVMNGEARDPLVKKDYGLEDWRESPC